MNDEAATQMNNEKLMKIFDLAKIYRNYSLFIIHHSFFIFFLTILFLYAIIKM